MELSSCFVKFLKCISCICHEKSGRQQTGFSTFEATIGWVRFIDNISICLMKGAIDQYTVIMVISVTSQQNICFTMFEQQTVPMGRTGFLEKLKGLVILPGTQ